MAALDWGRGGKGASANGGGLSFWGDEDVLN